MKTGMKRTDLKRVLKPIVKELIQESIEEILLEDDYINEHINNMILNSDMLKSITEQVAYGIGSSYKEILSENVGHTPRPTSSKQRNSFVNNDDYELQEEYEHYKAGKELFNKKNNKSRKEVANELAKKAGLDVFNDVNVSEDDNVPLEILMKESYGVPMADVVGNIKEMSTEEAVRRVANPNSLIQSMDPQNTGGIPVDVISALTGGKTKFNF